MRKGKKTGPKPKLPEIKILNDNPGRREIAPVAAFIHLDEVPPAPPGLGAVARECWEDTAPLLHAPGVLKKTDLRLLESYCRTWQSYRESCDALDESGMTFIDRNGNSATSPEYKNHLSALDKFLKFSQELGLTPTARNHVAFDKGMMPGPKKSKLEELQDKTKEVNEVVEYREKKA